MGAFGSIGKFIVKESVRHAKNKQAQAARVTVHMSKADIKGAIADLHSDENLSKQYLAKLIHEVKWSGGVKQIMSYLKSDAAANLSPWEKAELWIACLDRLRFLDIVQHFFG